MADARAAEEFLCGFLALRGGLFVGGADGWIAGVDFEHVADLVDQHKEAIDALAAGDAKKLESAVRLDILEGMKLISDASLKR